METRYAADAWPSLDFRVQSDGDGLRFSGYAAVFDSESEDLGGFTETIAPGAFNRTLADGHDIRMFLNHNQDIVLGSSEAGTLRLAEDDYGLRVEADLPDSEWGRPVAKAVERRDIRKMSFGFRPKDVERLDGGKRRRLREVRLFEVSPITAWPAYEGTQAYVRAIATLADVDETTAAVALRVLESEDGELTNEQHDLLMRAIEARSPKPITTPLYDAARQRLAELTA